MVKQLKIWTLLFLSLLSIARAKGQYYSLGTESSRVKWSLFESENYRVIFPTEIDSLAKRYSLLLESIREPVLASLEVNPKKIDVVLHPYSALSNGMVAWAPRRVELITTPPPNIHYIANWERSLTAHELRHVGQFSKFERGIFKPLSWIIGEQAPAVGVGLYMGQWTLEGDAVVTETEHTRWGRGRDPDHLIYFKAAFLEGEYRSWDRWTMGSYRHFVPDHYSFGYLFSSFIRERAGASYNYLGRISNYIVDHFYNPNVINRAYREVTGLTRREHWENLKDSFTKEWREEERSRGVTTLGEPLSDSYKKIISKREYANYSDIVEYNGEYYLIKSDLDRISRLVKVDSLGRERALSYFGRVSSPLKRVGERLYWTEYIADRRWEMENYSDLFSYNLTTKKRERLTRGGRYFNPSFSKEGELMALISYNIVGHYKVKLLSTDELETLCELTPPEGVRVREALIADEYLYLNTTSHFGNQLFKLSLKEALCSNNRGVEWRALMEPTEQMIINLTYHSESDKLYFISNLNGPKNLYTLNPNSGELEQMTNVRFGISSYSVDESGKIAINDFSINGYNPLLLKSTPIGNPAPSFKSSSMEELERDESEQEINFDYKRYRKASHLFKFHSWAPVYYNVDNITSLSFESIYDLVAPGVTLYSQNSLSTATTMAGYSYRDGFHAGHLKFSYRGFYPVIEFECNINERERREGGAISLEGSPYFNSHLLLYLPLNFSSGGWNRGVIPRLFWRYTNDSYYSYNEAKFSNYQYLNGGVNLYSVLTMSHRDLFPKWGAGLTLQYRAAPFTGENFGSLLYSSLYFYTPGVGIKDGIRGAITLQRQFAKEKNYLMANAITFPFGYLDRYSKFATSLNLDYGVPLYSGDLSLTSLLYVKRIKLFPFFNYCLNEAETEFERLYSAGAELSFDLKLLTINFPLSIGVKGGYTGERRSHFQFILQASL